MRDDIATEEGRERMRQRHQAEMPGNPKPVPTPEQSPAERRIDELDWLLRDYNRAIEQATDRLTEVRQEAAVLEAKSHNVNLDEQELQRRWELSREEGRVRARITWLEGRVQLFNQEKQELESEA